MSFIDCINQALASGRMSPRKHADAVTEYQRVYASLLQAGRSLDEADYVAAQEALKAVTSVNYEARKIRIADMRAQYRLHQRVAASGERPGDVLDPVMHEVAASNRELLGQQGQIISKLLEKFKPRFGGFTPVEDTTQIVFGMYGRQVDPTATAMARATQDLLTFQKDTLNLAGASIHDNPNFRLWQAHNPEAMLKAGKQKWVDDHLATIAGDDAVDWSIVQFRGRPVAPADRRAVLEMMWESNVTGGKNKQKPGVANTESLPTKLSRERFIYYKTPEAYLELQGKYGTGDFYHYLINSIYSTARNVSLMRMFGANPSQGKAFLERAVESRAAMQKLTMDPDKAIKVENRTSRQVSSFREQYAIHSREIEGEMGDATMTVLAAARSYTSSAALASSILANMSDPFYSMFMKHMQRLPVISTIPRTIHALLNYNNSKQQMIDNAIIVESDMIRAYEGEQYTMLQEGKSWTRAIGHSVYWANGVTAWTNTQRGSAAFQLAQVFAYTRHLPFDQLPFAHEMAKLQIGPAEWDMFRQIPLHTPQYYKFGTGNFLRPIDFVKAATTDAEREAANKIRLFEGMVVDDTIPQPYIKSRAVLGESMPAHAPRTQLWRTMTPFMTFPVNIHYQYWKRIMEAPNNIERSKRIGLFFAYTMAAGAFITQLKDTMNGKELHPMDTKEFWLRAAFNGGAGGILGDFLFDSILQATPYGANTPLGQQIENFRRFFVSNFEEFQEGKDLNLLADGALLGWGLFPYKVPGLKVLAERQFVDPLLQISDPAAYRRKLRAQAKWEADQGQGTWWGVGDEAPWE